MLCQGALHPPPAPAVLKSDAEGLYVELVEGEAGVAPGQACALYSGTGEDARVYGGGFIRRSEREPAAEAALKALLRAPAAVKRAIPAWRENIAFFPKTLLDTSRNSAL